jgi:hypothetical protein
LWPAAQGVSFLNRRALIRAKVCRYIFFCFFVLAVFVLVIGFVAPPAIGAVASEPDFAAAVDAARWPPARRAGDGDAVALPVRAALRHREKGGHSYFFEVTLATWST